MSGATMSVGEVSERSGVAVSALHFYERKELIGAERTTGNQRRFRRDVLRRLALIRIGQRVGIPLGEIRDALEQLPGGRTPTRRDWERLSRRWRDDLDTRIAALQELRDDFTGCIGCGCLSLRQCSVSNPGDVLAEDGPGARRLPVRG